MKNLLIITQKVDKNDQLLGFFIEWLRLFANNFKNITVLCLEKGQFSLPNNVKVLSLGKDSGVSKLKQLVHFYKLIYGHKNNYDEVFVHMNPIWVVLGGVSWHLMKKKIFFWYTSGGVTTKLKIAEKLADTILTASKESFRLPSKKVIVTGHGIDTELFKPDLTKKINDGKSRLLSVGRIALVKNYETLVSAAKILKSKNIDFSVTMIGEAPLEKDKKYEEQLKLLIASYKLQNTFNFTGKVVNKDLPPYYQSHDIFIHLSKTGSLDKTILEAMACGMKVLSSNDSARSFLEDKYLFNENDPSMLAEKIIFVIEEPVSPELRNYVVNHNKLDDLIEKISNRILE